MEKRKYKLLNKLITFISSAALITAMSVPFPVQAACGWTLDNTIGGGPSASVTSYTLSFTVAANALVVISSFNNNNLSTVTATMNGVAMSKDASGSDGSALFGYIFSSYSTTTGNVNITVSNGSATNFWIYGGSFLGSSARSLDASGNTSGNSTSATSNLTTTVDNEIHLATLVNENGSVQTPSAGTQAVSTDGTGTHGIYASSPYCVSPAGSNSTTVTWTGNSVYFAVGATYKLVAAASTPSFLPVFNLWGNW